jgi:hypothetical protein
MSDSTPQPAGPGQPTRQQLDELEALMERMLALPVHAALDDSLPTLAPVTPPPVVEPARPPAVYQLSAAADAPPLRIAEGAANTPTGSEMAPEQTAAELAALPKPPALPAALAVTPVPVARPPAQSPPQRPVAPAPIPRLPRPPVIWWVRPFLLLNFAFDRLTRPLGRMGAWLRAPIGRAWLGALGVLFILAAVVWVCLDLTGWTW